jgi:hypothetical protein
MKRIIPSYSRDFSKAKKKEEGMNKSQMNLGMSSSKKGGKTGMV